MAIQSETELYLPIKQFLHTIGYEVKGEVKHCDLVAIKDNEDEPVIVELKKTFNLPLLLQGIERLKLTEQVYLAVERPRKGRAPYGSSWNEITRLCRMLGLGLITVTFYKTKKPVVEILCEPTPYTPKISRRRKAGLLHEFHERSGDYNIGGSTRQKLVTAYRETALLIASLLQQRGPLSPRELKQAIGSGRVDSILQKNYYGWFSRIKRGIYELTPSGAQALLDFAEVLTDHGEAEILSDHGEAEA